MEDKMKKYEDLSEIERGKINTFIHKKNGETNDYNLVLILAEVFFAMTFMIGGIIILAAVSLLTPAILFLNTYQSDMFLRLAYSFMQISPFIMLGGAVGYIIIVAIAYYKKQQEKKKDHLIFGYTSIDDAFEIKKTDISNLKKTWKKVK